MVRDSGGEEFHGGTLSPGVQRARRGPFRKWKRGGKEGLKERNQPPIQTLEGPVALQAWHEKTTRVILKEEKNVKRKSFYADGQRTKECEKRKRKKASSAKAWIEKGWRGASSRRAKRCLRGGKTRTFH